MKPANKDFLDKRKLQLKEQQRKMKEIISQDQEHQYKERNKNKGLGKDAWNKEYKKYKEDSEKND